MTSEQRQSESWSGESSAIVVIDSEGSYLYEDVAKSIEKNLKRC